MTYSTQWSKILVAILILLSILLLAGIAFFVYSGTFFRGLEKTLEFNGQTRRYRVHLPSGFDSKKPTMLLIALHGLGDHPRLMELYSGLSIKADQENFIVVYPYGTKGATRPKLSWNGMFCCGEAWKSGVDDVGFLKTLISQLQADYAIDSSKIFMTGFSNGAIMTYRFAIEAPGILRAGAIVQGSMGGKVTSDSPFLSLGSPTQSLPLLVIHGKKDHVIPYEGGTGGDPNASFESVENSLAPWIALHPQVTKKVTPILDAKIEQTDYMVRDSLLLRHLALERTGHMWPGIMNIYEMLWNRPHFWASDALVDFFQSR